MAILPIPRFVDGRVLNERDLYQLARLSFEANRWGAVAVGCHGFFAPPPDLGLASWNRLSPSGCGWTLDPLFLIAPSGYPLVTNEPTAITGSGSRLFAHLRIPEDSQQHVDHGYKIDFEWDPKAPPVCPWALELGEVDPAPATPTFRLKPPAITVHGTPGLGSAARALAETLRQFQSLLLRHGRSRPLDAALTLDRIDRHLHLPAHARTDEYLSSAVLLLEAVKGFFHRLAWEEGSADETARRSALAGRSLEDWLIGEHHRGRTGIVPERLDELLSEPRPTGATDQEKFVQALGQLFVRTATLSQRLSMRELQNEPGYPRDAQLDFQLHCYPVPAGTRAVLVYLARADNNTFSFEGQANLDPKMRLFPRRAHQMPDGHQACYRLAGAGRYLYLTAQRSTVQRVCPEELPA